MHPSTDVWCTTPTVNQVVYYGLLQLFLTPRALYILVWDAKEARKIGALNVENLEDLAIAPWLRYLTFRVPDATVVLVGNKCDSFTEDEGGLASDVERQSRVWLAKWTEKAHQRQAHQLCLEKGVSLVSCAPRGEDSRAALFDGELVWPCDRTRPGLLNRIVRNPVPETTEGAPAVGTSRGMTMCLPSSWQLALEVLEEQASRSRYGLACRF